MQIESRPLSLIVKKNKSLSDPLHDIYSFFHPGKHIICMYVYIICILCLGKNFKKLRITSHNIMLFGWLVHHKIHYAV